MAGQYQKLATKTLQELTDIANKIRIHSIIATQASASGHPTSCSSVAEILSVLFFNTMRYKVSDPRDPGADRLILSKGHAAPALYAAWAETGLIPVTDLEQLRKFESDLEGHPTPRLSFVDVATGSLGQGLAIAAGMAYVGKNYDKCGYRVYCVIGDGESAEGSIWESLHFASLYRLDNLCVILDANRLGQSQATSLGHDMQTYKKRFEAFGCHAIPVDGHNIEELAQAFYDASNTRDRPTAVLAKTFKGKSFLDIEDKDNYHGKPLMGAVAESVLQHLATLVKNPGLTSLVPLPPAKPAPNVNITNIKLSSPPSYELGESIATRYAYGTALVKIAQNNPRVIALDGDTKNSTYSEALKKFDATRYVECFIAEQNLVGVAIGATCRNRTVAFVSTFAAFFTRAFDQIRMGAISQTNVNFVGSHCGVSIGEDGPSQMALEDIAMFRTIPNGTVFYPADAVATERSVELAANTPGICYIRTNRPKTSVIYPNDFKFEIGKANVVRQTAKDAVLVIGGGVTLQAALVAAVDLGSTGTTVRVMDLFTIKPIDKQAIIQNAAECEGRVLVVEDHYYEGGIGEAVMSTLALEKNVIVKHVAISNVPKSGPPHVLMDHFGIDAKHIIGYVREMLRL